MWCRNNLATARAQDEAEILNPDYQDVSDDDVVLFKEKYKFTHAVFDKILQTDRWNKCLREHKQYYNTQSAH